MASPVAAQSAAAQIVGLVQAWLEEEATDFPTIVREYGVACIAPLVVAMPEPAQLVIIDAGGIEDGLSALEAEDPEAVDALMPELQLCVETMLVGGQIWPWVQAEGRNGPLEVQTVIAICLMEAIRPLSTEAKQIIFLGADFEDGTEILIETRPDLAGDLDARLEFCFWRSRPRNQ